jgi:hypothetical protein
MPILTFTRLSDHGDDSRVYLDPIAAAPASGALDGVDWWRDVHARGDEPAWLPPPLSAGQDGEGSTESTE